MFAMTPNRLHCLVVIHGQSKDDPFDIEQLNFFNIMKWKKKERKKAKGLWGARSMNYFLSNCFKLTY